MRILFIAPYTPGPTRVRSYQLVQGLAALGHSVTVAALAADQADEDRLERFRELGMDVVWTRLPVAQTVRNCLAGLLSRRPLQASYCWQPKLAARLRRLVAERDFDVIHVEHLRGAVYGLDLKRFLNGSSATRVPIVWDSVDCISRLLEQASTRAPGLTRRWLIRFELERTRQWESWLTSQFDLSVTTTRREAEALRALVRPRLDGNGRPDRTFPSEPEGPGPDIRVVCNGVDLNHRQGPGRRETEVRPVIAMSGRMSYHANIAAALFLVKEVMPGVWSRRPHTVVRLIGEKPPPVLQRLAKLRPGCIEVLGSVDDLQSALKPVVAAVAPMPYGVGVQNKVLEAMSCRIPVVATPAVLDGVQARPGEEILIGRNAAELARQLLLLLEDHSLRRSIGESGRRYVEQHHCWARKTQELVAVYQDACAARLAR